MFRVLRFLATGERHGSSPPAATLSCSPYDKGNLINDFTILTSLHAYRLAQPCSSSSTRLGAIKHSRVTAYSDSSGHTMPSGGPAGSSDAGDDPPTRDEFRDALAETSGRMERIMEEKLERMKDCLLYTSPSPRD